MMCFCVTLTMLKIVPRSIDHTRHVLYILTLHILLYYKIIVYASTNIFYL